MYLTFTVFSCRWNLQQAPCFDFAATEEMIKETCPQKTSDTRIDTYKQNIARECKFFQSPLIFPRPRDLDEENLQTW